MIESARVKALNLVEQRIRSRRATQLVLLVQRHVSLCLRALTEFLVGERQSVVGAPEIGSQLASATVVLDSVRRIALRRLDTPQPVLGEGRLWVLRGDSFVN